MSLINPMHNASEPLIGNSDSIHVEKTDAKRGLTSEEVVALRAEHGWNQLDVIEISLWRMFFLQFTGTMPYMLEVCVVITIITGDFLDMGIILFMLIANASLGFKEQLEAAHALAELTKKMESKINCLRDGGAELIPTNELVPGDVVHLTGGCQVPADIEWLEGDVLSIDTAALTGEPIPRKYPDPKFGNILCGCTIMAGEAYGIVKFIGTKTEAGAGQAEIANDKATVKVSVFEKKVLQVVQIVVAGSTIIVLAIILIQGFLRREFYTSKQAVRDVLLSALSIIVASIPIALPIVLQVTLALGAGKMARDFHAVVTSVPALQDIASMSVLCSDKTGTLTTAKITIAAEKVWTAPGFQKEDVALYAYLAANPDKKEDPIDRSVLGHYKEVFGSRGPKIAAEYAKIRSVGFNPIYKRTVYEWSHAQFGKITIGKGLVFKVMDTEDGGKDDHQDQWKVENLHELLPEVRQVDYDLSKAGYKTLGVSMKIEGQPWKFVGILAQMDPPRVDSEITINALRDAGVKVKMITGDHLNIAKETARKIGLGTDAAKKKIPNIQPGSICREKSGTKELEDLILNADGFAQVLPSDKREVVLVLKNKLNLVVGMTGDGVNDAPALSAAQCGVAVDDATDAAKGAAAIILQSEGLSAIYNAVVESRRIFRKLKAYVTYRFAASIQIVTVLAFLILVSNCSINPLYIILLALLNDLTMLPIAYDYQQASKNPENPDVNKILITSLVLGFMETGFSLLFAYTAVSLHGKWFQGNYHIYQGAMGNGGNNSCDVQTQAAIFIQMFISAELLIFSTRAPSYMIISHKPSFWLTFCVLAGCALMSVLVVFSKPFGKISGRDVGVIYAYNVVTFFIIDAVKVQLMYFFGEEMATLPDRDVIKEELAKKGISMDASHGHHNHGGGAADATAAKGVAMRALGDSGDMAADRMSIAGERMTNWAIKNDSHLSKLSLSDARQSIADNKMRKSQALSTASAMSTEKSKRKEHHVDYDNMRASLVNGVMHSSGSDRPSLLGGSIRPNTPAARLGK